MPAFFYTAVDASGKQVSGNVIVRNKSEAYRELEARTLIPVSVGLEGEFAGKGKSKAATAKSGPRRLKRAELILFTEELADLLDAGMQLERALKILNERSTSPSIKAVAGFKGYIDCV